MARYYHLDANSQRTQHLPEDAADFRARDKVALGAEDGVARVHVVPLRRVRETHLHVGRERDGAGRFYAVDDYFFDGSYWRWRRVRRESFLPKSSPWNPPPSTRSKHDRQNSSLGMTVLF